MYLQEVEGQRPDVMVLPRGPGQLLLVLAAVCSAGIPTLGAFAPYGPGGRVARVRRFLDAQPGRPRAFEHLGLARFPGHAG